jgi:ATP-dependent helicase/nuclease subunit B
MYLALDGREIEEAEHPDVERTAERLLHGMVGDLDRIKQGAPLPPLGEGSVCEHCEARGLCRKGHWTTACVNEEPT